jgi:hypothetical protein
MVFIPTTELELFEYKDLTNRSGYAAWVGKGSQTHALPGNCTMITHSYPAARTELASLFKSVEAFYCFDNLTALTTEARLCGCPTIVFPDGSIPMDSLYTDISRNGLCFSEEELSKARDTIHLFKDDYASWLNKIEGAVKQLADVSQERFK